MVKRKKDKTDGPNKLSHAKAATKLPALQQSTTALRSTLGLLHQKVFHPTQPPIVAFGYFPFIFLLVISKIFIKMSIESAKVLKTEPLVNYLLQTQCLDILTPR